MPEASDLWPARMSGSQGSSAVRARRPRIELCPIWLSVMTAASVCYVPSDSRTSKHRHGLAALSLHKEPKETVDRVPSGTLHCA